MLKAYTHRSYIKRKDLKINISLARSCLNWEARIGKGSLKNVKFYTKAISDIIFVGTKIAYFKSRNLHILLPLCFFCSFVLLQLDRKRSRENHNSVTHKKGRSLLRVKKMTLKFSFKKYFLNPKLNIIFIPSTSTGCGNASILECKCPFIRHSS